MSDISLDVAVLRGVQILTLGSTPPTRGEKNGGEKHPGVFGISRRGPRAGLDSLKECHSECSPLDPSYRNQAFPRPQKAHGTSM
jgi:hypothetical protein